MNSRRRASAIIVLAVLLAAAPHDDAHALASSPETADSVTRQPGIRPDYSNTVIPPNIAPLNFAVQEPGTAYRVRLRSEKGTGIDIRCNSPSVTIPPRQWRTLLEQNRGGRLSIEIEARREDGTWRRFAPIESAIARENIDSHLVYRLLGAVFVNWNHIGIYQRDLETYDERPILCNTSFENGCVNCHAFANGNPELFSLQVRPSSMKPFASGMLVVREDSAARLSTQSKALPTPPTYTTWHPSGRWAAVSLTRSEQFMHSAGAETREVYDRYSDLALIDTMTGEISSPSVIADPGKIETFPAWSADGRCLYFCTAPIRKEAPSLPPFAGSETVRYDLMRIPFDPETLAWGKLETVLTADRAGGSISEPRPSPDGRFLVFCRSDHGAFQVLQSDCDLYIMDLTQKDELPFRPMAAANSPRTDSWHCWSRNSRWLVFSSKRDSGLFARPYISYIDREGHESKPFVVPQKDPLFYDSYLKTYNVPELVEGPVRVSQQELSRAIHAAASPESVENHAADAVAPN